MSEDYRLAMFPLLLQKIQIKPDPLVFVEKDAVASEYYFDLGNNCLEKLTRIKIYYQEKEG